MEQGREGIRLPCLRRDRPSNDPGKWASRRHQLMLQDRANIVARSLLLFLPLSERWPRVRDQLSPSYMLALMNW
jgi:hypothetical protein